LSDWGLGDWVISVIGDWELGDWVISVIGDWGLGDWVISVIGDWVTMAAAPRSIASGMNCAPSMLTPGYATNNAPGMTSRELAVTRVMSRLEVGG